MAPYLAESASQGQAPHTPPEVIRVHCGGLHSPPAGSSPGGESPGGESSSLSPASTPPAPSPPPVTQEAEQDGTPCQVSPGQSPGGEVMYFSYPPPPHYPYPPAGAFLQYPVCLPPGVHYHPASHYPVPATAQSPGYVTLPPPQGMPQCQVVYSQGYPIHNAIPSECLSSPTQQNSSVPPLQSPGYATLPPPQSIPQCQVVYSQGYPVPPRECISSPIQHDPSVLEVGPSSSPVSQTTSGVVSPDSEPPPVSTLHTEPHHHQPLQPNPSMPATCPDQPPAMVPPPAMPPTHPGHAAMLYAPTASQQPYMGYSAPGGGVPMYTVAAMPPMGATGGEGTCVQVGNSYPLPDPGQAVLYAPPPDHPVCHVAPPSGMDMAPTAEGSSWRDAPAISLNMELVWHGEFNSRFVTFSPQRWYLIPVEKPPGETAATLWPSDLYLPSVPWRTFRDSAKVRFCCDSCGNGWTSMKGRVIFWFYQDPKDLQGYVLFKLYGQQCKRCANGQFEHAMWYPDEVVKVIENLYHRVGQVYYSFFRPPLRIERRSGKPREQHNSELCQACKEGLCQEELMFT